MLGGVFQWARDGARTYADADVDVGGMVLDTVPHGSDINVA